MDVCQLLAKFSDVFSAGPHDLGCTDLVKHHIDTGSSKPVRQPPRGTHKDSYPCPGLMTPSMHCPELSGSPLLISTVDIGRSSWMKVPKRKQPSQLAMDCGSSKSCHLDFVMVQLPLND